MNESTAFATGSSGTPALLEAPPQKGAAARDRIHRFASWMHGAIDKVEQNLGSTTQDGMATQSKYVGQAQEYGNKLRDRFNEKPVQSASIALAAGAVLHKMMASKPKPQVRVVKVPVYQRAGYGPTLAPERRTSVRNLGRPSTTPGLWATQAAGKAGAATGMAIGSTKAMAATLAERAGTLPLQMRLATQRLLARSQEYGSVARSGVQAHPLVGVGGMLGVGALVTTLLMKRRQTMPSPAYVTVDDKGNGLAWQRDRPGMQSSAMDMVASRPVASAALMLGVGALVGAMLRRS